MWTDMKLIATSYSFGTEKQKYIKVDFILSSPLLLDETSYYRARLMS